MDSLRLSLLIIGVLIVLGIYLWEIYKSPVNRKSITDSAEDRSDYPGRELSGPDESRYSDATGATGDLAPGAEAYVVETAVAGEEAPGGNERASVQSEAEHEGKDNHSAVPIEDEQEAGIQNIEAEQRLITLYIVAAENTVFDGLSISYAAQGVGMVYGHRNIFNYYIAGNIESDPPLFSLANMFEPGAFDLDSISEFRTTGIILFMPLPMPTDNPAVFELFVDGAHQIAEVLGGDIYTDKNGSKPLDDADIEAMRQCAKSRS